MAGQYAKCGWRRAGHIGKARLRNPNFLLNAAGSHCRALGSFLLQQVDASQITGGGSGQNNTRAQVMATI